MGIEITMAAIGDFGKYQRRVFVLLCLVCLPFSVFETGPIFWAFTPEYQCVGSISRPNQKDVKYEQTELVIDLTGIDNNDHDHDRCYTYKHQDTKTNEHTERQQRTQCGNYTFGGGGQESMVNRVSNVYQLSPTHPESNASCFMCALWKFKQLPI